MPFVYSYSPPPIYLIGSGGNGSGGTINNYYNITNNTVVGGNITGNGTSNTIPFWFNSTTIYGSRFTTTNINTTSELSNLFYSISNPSGFISSYIETDPVWTLDKPNYATILYVLGMNNLSYTQIATNIGNYSQDEAGLYTNISSKSGLGVCPSGQFVQNLTTSTPECFTPTASVSESSIVAVLTKPKTRIYKQTYDFESVTAGYTNLWIPTAIVSGTVTFELSEVDKPGIVNITSVTGQGTPGYAFQQSNIGSFLLTNQSYFITVVKPLTKTGNYSVIRAGYLDIFTSSAITDGLFASINTSNNHSNITLFAVNNSVVAKSLTYQLNATDQWLRLEGYVINSTLAVLYVYNESSEALITTLNVTSLIPTTKLRETSSGLIAFSQGNTTAQRMASLDYFEVGINASMIR